MKKGYENILQSAAAIVNLLLGLGFVLNGIGVGGGLIAPLSSGILGIVVGVVLLASGLLFFNVIK